MIPKVHHGDTEDTEKKQRIQWALTAMIVLIAVLNLAVFAQRLTSVLRDGQYVVTTGIESPALYGIWKRLHGFPVYEFPNGGSFAAQLFNFGFYEFYARVLRWLRIDGAAISVGARLITLAFGLAGMLLTAALLRRMLPGRMNGAQRVCEKRSNDPSRDREGAVLCGPLPYGRGSERPSYTPSQRICLLCLAITLWLGTNFTSWWTLTARPDVAAAALVTAGTLLYLGAVSRKSLWRLAAASCVFFLAWTMKQTFVFTFASAIVCTVWVLRSGRATMALILPFAMLAAASIAAGTPAYRYLCFHVPRVAPLDLHYAAMTLLKVVGTAWQIFVPAFVLGTFVLIRFVRGQQRFDWKQSADPAQFGPLLLAVVAIVAGIVGVLGMTRSGASRNYLFECFFAAGTLWALALMRPTAGTSVREVAASPSRMALWMLILVVTAALPAAQLALPNRIGKQIKADARTRQMQTRLGQRCTALPKPLLTFIEPFNLPWFSSQNEYPAYVIDPYVYEPLRKRGLLTETLEDQIRSAKIRSLVTESWNESAHYADVAAAGGWHELQTDPGELQDGVRVFLAPR